MLAPRNRSQLPTSKKETEARASRKRPLRHGSMNLFNMRRCFGKSFSGTWFGPSESARAGFSCTSMKIPSQPAASAARASTGASFGIAGGGIARTARALHTEWVASKIT